MVKREDASCAQGIRSYARSGMVKKFTRELIDTLPETFVAGPALALYAADSLPMLLHAASFVPVVAPLLG